MLLDNGIVTPMRVFHARVVDNAQDRRITKATVEPQLEHAAARIAAVVLSYISAVSSTTALEYGFTTKTRRLMRETGRSFKNA